MSLELLGDQNLTELWANVRKTYEESLKEFSQTVAGVASGLETIEEKRSAASNS
jgi:hypothetical protein